jgi:hypothetical protein
MSASAETLSRSLQPYPAMNWFTLIQPFVDIALLRTGPQALPSSRFLLAVTYAGYMAIAAITFSMRYGPAVVAATAALDVLLLTGFVAIVLDVKGQRARVLQSLTALLGSGAVLGFCVLPIQVWFMQAEHGDAINPGHVLIWLLLVGWDLLIRANVLRHALECSWWLSLAFSLAYFWISLRLIQTLLVAMGALGPS